MMEISLAETMDTLGEAENLEYRNLSLKELIMWIVKHNDRKALNDFLNNRTLFRHIDSEPLLFIEYINRRKEEMLKKKRLGNHSVEVADFTFNLVVDKFSNLPNSEQFMTESKRKNHKLKHEGPDCRNYFKAFLAIEKQESENEPLVNWLEKEERCAKLMQGLVNRHISLSLREALRRTNDFQSRYNYKINGSIITVWLPISLKGRDREEWLRKNIKDINPERPRERQRIQDEINKLVIKKKMLSINDSISISDKEFPPFLDDSQKNFGISLANRVAMRKTMNIHLQRPSIKKLGKKKLEDLILRIFDDLTYGEETDTHLAKEFGISKATLSRFAGKKWNQNIGREENYNIPDLWRNTAKILKNNEEFMETVIASGYVGRLEESLDIIEPLNEIGA